MAKKKVKKSKKKPTSNNSSKKELKGIGGWLLFYTILLFIEASFWGLLTFSLSFLTFLNPLLGIITSIILLAPLSIFLIIILSLTRIYQKKKTAYFWNMLYLTIAIGLSIIQTNYLFGIYRIILVFSILINVLWIGYWWKSKRVKNTFVK